MGQPKLTDKASSTGPLLRFALQPWMFRDLGFRVHAVKGVEVRVEGLGLVRFRVQGSMQHTLRPTNGQSNGKGGVKEW